MTIVQLRAHLDSHAWGPDGPEAMRTASAEASPVPVVVAGFDALRDLDPETRSPEATDLLRRCAEAIRAHHLHGRAAEAAAALATLPPAPTSIALATPAI